MRNVTQSTIIVPCIGADFKVRTSGVSNVISSCVDQDCFWPTTEVEGQEVNIDLSALDGVLIWVQKLLVHDFSAPPTRSGGAA
jgi:hypothetical protein